MLKATMINNLVEQNCPLSPDGNSRFCDPNSVYVPACRISPHGKITFVNKAFCELVKKSRKVLLGASFLKVIPQRYYRVLDSQMSRLTPDSNSTVIECDFEPEIALALQLDFNGEFNSSGELEQVQIIAHDITRMKNAENRMRHLADTELVISTISSSFINVRSEDIGGKIDAALHLVGEFVGVSRCSVFIIKEEMRLGVQHEWCGDGIRSLKGKRQELKVDELPWILDKLKRNLIVNVECRNESDVKSIQLRSWLRSKNMMSILLVPMFSNGALIGVLAFETAGSHKNWNEEHITRLRTISEIFVNVKAQRRADREIKKHRELLVQADRLSSLGVLVAGVAHEINNPTSIITSSTPIIQDVWKDALPILEEHYQRNGDFKLAGINFSEVKDEVTSLCDSVRNSGDRIKDIVLELKDVSKKKQYDKHTLVNINSLINKAISLTRKAVKHQTMNMRVNLSDTLPLTRGDAQRLLQVLINLIVNAGQALSDTDQSISISSNEYDNSIIIVVEDEGQGIHPDDLSKIFDPFFTKKEDGTGLGLSISHTIISEHNGLLEFTSEVGVGTRATITLPVVQLDAQEVQKSKSIIC